MLQRLFKRLAPALPWLLIAGLFWKMMKKTDKISDNFSFEEFGAPDDAKIRANIKRLVDNVLQPLRNAIGKPIIITSGFRDQVKNDQVGGVKKSLHLTGQAADFYIKGADLSDVYNIIQSLKLPFDELILYRPGARSKFGHLHISYISPDKNRRKTIITEPNYKRQ